jgi:uncharacterized heparinase superfamily protein
MAARRPTCSPDCGATPGGRWLQGPLYRHTLLGPVPADLRLRLNERWPGDAERGAAILAGDIGFCGELVRNPMPVWFPAGTGPDWLAAWHGFGWLADLISIGAPARDPARALVQSWLADNSAWHPVAWRSDVVATRIFAWIVHFEEIVGREVDRALRRAMLASIAAQVRHLSRTAAWELTGAPRLRALKGLIGGHAALGGSHQRISRALRALERELPLQILPDGGHRSRNPSVQLAVLRDLIDLRAVLRIAHLEVPTAMQQAIERMAPMLRFFRHGDRRLALFNNSIEEDGVIVDLALTRSETRGHPPMQAPQCRVSAASGGAEPGAGRYRQAAAARLRHGGARRYAVVRAEPGARPHCRQLRRVSRHETGLGARGARQRGAFGAGCRRHQFHRNSRRWDARAGACIGALRARRRWRASMDRREP